MKTIHLFHLVTLFESSESCYIHFVKWGVGDELRGLKHAQQKETVQPIVRTIFTNYPTQLETYQVKMSWLNHVCSEAPESPNKAR